MDSASLPAELFEKIIFAVWTLPLSNSDRIHLMISFPLVNSTWKALFTRISFKDVHIPCPSYLTTYMAALAGYPSHVPDNQPPPKRACQFITIKIPLAVSNNGITEDYEQENPMGKTLSNLLYYLDGIIDAPNLRTIRIDYENIGFDDIFDRWRLAYFPVQVTDLEISFSFDRDLVPDNASRVTHLIQNSPTVGEVDTESYSLYHVKRITVSGASDTLMAHIIACCPNARCVSMECSPRASS